MVFSFIGIHVVDSGTSSAFCSKVTHLSAVKAWSFGFAWLAYLGHMDFILSCIIFIILGGIGLWLAWPIAEVVVRESGMSYVHWDWHIIILSGCIR